jgi:hypothetical protein
MRTGGLAAVADGGQRERGGLGQALRAHRARVAE